jgi:hypothetical protein
MNTRSTNDEVRIANDNDGDLQLASLDGRPEEDQSNQHQQEKQKPDEVLEQIARSSPQMHLECPLESANGAITLSNSFYSIHCNGICNCLNFQEFSVTDLFSRDRALRRFA